MDRAWIRVSENYELISIQDFTAESTVAKQRPRVPLAAFESQATNTR